MDDTPGGPPRRRLLALVAGTAGLSGCAGLFTADADRRRDEERPGDRSTPLSGTPNRPYEADRGPTLDDPGGLVVRNLASGSRYLTVVVTGDEQDVYVESRRVPAGERFAVLDLIGDPGEYGVVVETADGRRASYDWTVTTDLPDLWVDLTPAISFHRPFRCLRDCGSLAAVTTPPPATFPTAVSPAGRRDRTPALWLDNDADESRSVRLRIADGDETLFAAEYDLPPDARAVVPVSGRRRAYRVELATEAGESSEEWVPRLRRTLYGVVGGSPAFRCGLTPHDLVIDNETTDSRTVSVAVTAGGVGVFDRSVTLSPGEARRLPSAVDPRGTLSFEVTTDDGPRERYDWRFCAPRGPISITVGERGIDVTVTPSGG
ncbi:hypothetical protein [Salinirubrum litoreum]|uniref:Ig-like domain-containing protein n=1 Tax=Salinirubrum litoreum TaxID=1126234 RepID=A0ABD5RBL7_9EURY|nr:hypothetical protein [Salinirubrum litoreum]